MSAYPYIGQLAPSVGGGLGGLPRRGVAANLPAPEFGENWAQVTSAGARNWTNSCAAQSSPFFAACVSTGYIYTSSDNGDTWTEQTASGSRTWAALCCSDDGSTIYATGSSLKAYKSSDYGVTWQQLAAAPSSNAATSIACSYDGQIICYQASTNTIALSKDGGVTWNSYTVTGIASIKSICMSGDGSAIYCLNGAAAGGVYKSSASSPSSWITVTQSAVSNGGDICCSGDGQTVLVSYLVAPNVYISKDGGVTWKKITPQLPVTYTSCDESGARTILQIVGDSAGALITNDDNFLLKSLGNNPVFPTVNTRKGACSKFGYLVMVNGSYLYVAKG